MTNFIERTQGVSIILLFMLMPLMVRGQEKTYTQADSVLIAHLPIIDQQVIPADTAVRTGVLPNGLTYYVRSCNSPEKKANFHLLVKGGSVIEKENERGLAHFVEHMLFNGTKHFPGENVISFMRRNGIDHGHDSNAFTSFNTVQYFINSIPVTDELQVDSCLLLLRDWAGDATIADEEVERERNVIVEEWRLRQPAAYQQELRNDLFNTSIYTHRRPIGDMEVVKHCPPKRIRNFYKRWYQPQNLAVVVTGDFDADDMVEKIRKRFSDMKRGKNLVESYPIVPDFGNPLFRVYRDEKLAEHSTHIIIRLPKKQSELLNTVGDLRTKEIYSKIIELIEERLKAIVNKDNKFAVETFVITDVNQGPSFFLLGLGSSTDTWQQTLELLAKVMENIRRKGFTEYECKPVEWDENTFNKDTTALILPNDNMQSAGSEYWAYCLTSNFFNREAIRDCSSERFVDEFINNTITREQLDMAFKELAESRNKLIAATLPDNVTPPTEEEMMEVINRVNNMTDEELAEMDAHTNKKLEQLDVDSIEINPKPGALKKLNMLNDSISEAFLSNGVKVVLWKWKKEANNHNIGMIFGRPLGYTALQHNEVSYQDMLESCRRKYGLYDVYVNPYNDGMRIYTNFRKDRKSYWSRVDYLLKQLHASLTTTEVDSVEAAEAIKGIQKTAKAYENPQAQSVLKIKNLYRASLNRLIPPSVEEAQTYSVDRFKEVVKDYYSNFNGSTLIVQGDFDTDTIMPLLLKYIGSLPSKPMPVKRMAWESDHYRLTDTTAVAIITNKTPYCETYVYYTWEKDYCISQEVHAHNQVFESVLDKLLWDVLRIEHSDVYTPNCWIQDIQMPFPRMILTITYSCDPTQRERIVKDVCRIVNEMAEGNLITQNLIDSYVKEREKKANKEEKDDAELRSEYLNRELGYLIFDNSNLSYIKQVTPASLKAHIRQMLKKGNVHIGHLTTE